MSIYEKIKDILKLEEEEFYHNIKNINDGLDFLISNKPEDWSIKQLKKYLYDCDKILMELYGLEKYVDVNAFIRYNDMINIYNDLSDEVYKY